MKNLVLYIVLFLLCSTAVNYQGVACKDETQLHEKVQVLEPKEAAQDVVFFFVNLVSDYMVAPGSELQAHYGANALLEHRYLAVALDCRGSPRLGHTKVIYNNKLDLAPNKGSPDGIDRNQLARIHINYT